MNKILLIIMLFFCKGLFAQKFEASSYFNGKSVILDLNHIKKTYQLWSPHYTWDNYSSYQSDNVSETFVGPVIWSEGTYEKKNNYIILIDKSKKEKCQFQIEKEGNLLTLNDMQGFSVKDNSKNRQKINSGRGSNNKIEIVCIDELMKSSPRFYVSVKCGKPLTPTSEIYHWKDDTLVSVRKNIGLGYINNF